jgi:hypothetical protein
VYDVTVRLDACAHRFLAGQLLRVAVSGADWPNTMGPPRPVELTVHECRLSLPRWEGPSPYGRPTFQPGDPESGEDPAGVVWRVDRDVLARTVRCVVDHGSSYDVAGGAQAAEHYTGWVEVDRRTFVQRAHSEVAFRLHWPDTEVCSQATLDLAAGPEHIDVDIRLTARERGPHDEQSSPVAERHWRRRIPRDLA